MGERYNYKLLQNDRTIRVLHLTPSTSLASPLQCELFEVDLDRRPSFEALSYVWGRMTPGRHVLCRGSELPITENCEAALRCLRRRDRPRVLWVDAICINQSSNEEKSVQVALMGRIYGQAARVLVWLGNSSEMGAVAFKHLSRLGMACRSSTVMRLLSPVLLRRLQQASERITGSPDHLSNLVADLINDRYFSRMWTTQEVVLGNKCLVCYGESTTPWEDFGRAAILISSRSSRDGLPPGFLTFWALWRQRGEALDASTASKLAFLSLALMQDRVATDPRDKIFAFYGIFHKYNIDFPVPDYSKSAAEVYTEAAISVIKGTKSLLILSLVNNNDRLPGLRSWVPDWRDPGFAPPILQPQGFTLFKSKEPQLSEGERLLHVFGRVFGRIASCSESYREYPIFGDADLRTVAKRVALGELQRVRVLQDWTRTTLRLGSYPTGDDLMVAYFVTITQGFSKLNGGSKSPAGVSPTPAEEKAFFAWSQLLLFDELMYQYHVDRPDLSVPGYSSTDAEDPAYWALSNLYASQKLGVADTWDMHNTLTKLAENRALFTTDNGYLGIAIHTVRKGDLVVLLSHAGVPMVLRPVDAVRYQLVGPAYVHPLSDLVAVAAKGLGSLEEFVLV